MTPDDSKLVDVFMAAQATPEGEMFSDNILRGLKAVLAYARSETTGKTEGQLLAEAHGHPSQGFAPSAAELTCLCLSFPRSCPVHGEFNLCVDCDTQMDCAAARKCKYPRSATGTPSSARRTSEEIIVALARRCGWSEFHSRPLECFLEDAVKSLESATPFRATHRHAEGGLYQLLDDKLDVHVASNTWMPAVRYRNAEGREFVRTWQQWRERFNPISASVPPEGGRTDWPCCLTDGCPHQANHTKATDQ